MNVQVRLLVEDPEFAGAIPAAERATAEQLVVADEIRVGAGRWKRDDDGAAPLLMLSGAVVRITDIGGRRSAHILGPGDVIAGAAMAAEPVVPHEVAWTALSPSTVAILGDRFTAAARRWPELQTVVQARLHAQIDRLAVHLAIAQLPRVEQRLLGILWHLADRWGRVTPDGIVLPLAFTHGMLGELIGAQRPTVSLGLTDLQQAGQVSRLADGGWLLDPESRAAVSVPRSGVSDMPAVARLRMAPRAQQVS